MRFFNTAGPVVANDHYSIPPLERLNLGEIRTLVRDKQYFVLHAPRQTGKTSALLALRDLLNSGAEGDFRCVYVNVEAGQASREDVGQAMRAILYELEIPRRALADKLQEDRVRRGSPPATSGYTQRPEHFPHSVVLCGVRDVRDYRIHSSSEKAIAGGSAFNVKARSLRLGDFSQGEVRALLAQHTQETGQAFSPEALETISWLVNALAYEACFWNEAGREYTRDLDQLADKLQEDRVRRVVEPLLSGGDERSSRPATSYTRDLGLIAQHGPLRIANPIYAEVVPRELTSAAQEGLVQETAWYVDAGGGLDVVKLLAAFQEFFREHSEHWVARFDYLEAGPQLLLQAFLQRVVNGGCRIEREYGLGRGRTDLLILWPQGGRTRRFVVECKLLHKSLERTIGEGIAQTAAYMDRCVAEAGHLVIFDRGEGRWEDKVFHRREPAGSAEVHVWGM